MKHKNKSLREECARLDKKEERTLANEISLQARKNKTYPAILHLEVSTAMLTAEMSDGREVSIPVAWFSRLSNATAKQLKNFKISPSGYGIHWPDLDEDISVKAFLD